MPSNDAQFSEPYSQREEEEIVATGSSLKYGSVLDISPIKIFQEDAWLYFARAHFMAAVGVIGGYVFTVGLFVQLFFPAAYIPIDSIWDKNDIFTHIFCIFGILWQGPIFGTHDLRIPFSMFLACVFILFFIYLIIRIKRFKKNKRMPQMEATFVINFARVIGPVILPIMLSGLSPAIELWRKEGPSFSSCFVAVFCIPFTFFWWYLVVYFFSPRVIFENTPVHDWLPQLSFAAIVVTCANCTFVSSAGEVGPTGKTILMALQTSASFIQGFFSYFASACPKRTLCILWGAVGFAATLMGILQIINVYISFLQGPLVIIILVCALFIFVFMLNLIDKNRLAKYLQFYEECENDPNFAEENFNFYQGVTHFLSVVRSVVEFMPPYVLTWEPFEMALKKWDNNPKIFIVYAKFVAMFPALNPLLTKITLRLSETKCFALVSYLSQLKQIIQSRVSGTNSRLKSLIEEVQKKNEHLDIMLRKFWETVLQDEVGQFWDDITRVDRIIQEVEDQYSQLFLEYPNSALLLKLIIQFEARYRHDTRTINELKEKLRKVKTTGHSCPDKVAIIAQAVFPQIVTVWEGMTDTLEQSLFELDENDTDDSNDSEETIDVAITDIIDRSKLGSWWAPAIVLVFATVIVIIFFYVFKTNYQNNLIDAGIKYYNVIDKINDALYHSAQIPLLTDAIPMLLHKGLGYLNSKIIPTLHNVLGDYAINETMIQACSDSLNTETANLITYVNQMGDKKIIDEVTVKEIHNSKSLSTLLLENAFNIQSFIGKTDKNEILGMTEFVDINENFVSVLWNLLQIQKEVRDIGVNRIQSGFQSLNLWLVLTILATVLLVSLPFMLWLFRIQIQTESIAESFCKIPNSEVRRLISETSSHSVKAESQASTTIFHRASASSSIQVLSALIFFLTFFPMMVSGIALYYLSNYTSRETESIYYKLANCVQPFIITRMAATFVEKAYDINIKAYEGTSIDIVRAGLQQFLDMNTDYYSETFYGVNSTLGDYYSNVDKYDFFMSLFDPSPPRPLPLIINSYLERLVVAHFPDANDMILAQVSKENIDEDVLFSISYWFTHFTMNFRDKIYLGDVSKTFSDFFSDNNQYDEYIFIVVIILQIIACFSTIALIINRSLLIRKSLNMYKYIMPTVLLQNPQIMHLLTTATHWTKLEMNTFGRAEEVLSKVTQAIVITDTKLNIQDYNGVFSDLMRVTDDSLVGHTIKELFEDGSDKTWTPFLNKLEDVLNGIIPPSLSETVQIFVNADGRTLYTRIDVIFMTQHHPALDEEFKQIERIIFMIDDATESIEKANQLKKEQSEVSRMISKVIPANVVSELEGGANTVAFVSQSITVAIISFYKHFEEENQEMYSFYNGVFSKLDKMLEKFPLLSKVRVTGNVYIVAGGMFMTVNKMEKHAEETIRFVAQVIKEFESEEYNIVAGAHTGGPIVAGIMGLTRPHFQLIGSVTELAREMAEKGLPNKIHITRSVYELIFSAGFNITEMGDIKLRDGTEISTYLVNP